LAVKPSALQLSSPVSSERTTISIFIHRLRFGGGGVHRSRKATLSREKQ
jgi:hypothetical protein